MILGYRSGFYDVWVEWNYYTLQIWLTHKTKCKHTPPADESRAKTEQFILKFNSIMLYIICCFYLYFVVLMQVCINCTNTINTVKLPESGCKLNIFIFIYIWYIHVYLYVISAIVGNIIFKFIYISMIYWYLSICSTSSIFPEAPDFSIFKYR